MNVPIKHCGPYEAVDEAERLAALHRYGILDTDREHAFDEIARIAALVCRAPIALVSFVETERQWFKAEVGTGDGLGETQRSLSICTHAIRQSGVFVVPDTTKDERFRSNPLVVNDPHLRFYAGARLETPEGLAIGTVCVLDSVVRPDGLSQEQTETLLALARQTVTQLELRRTVTALEESREGLELLSRELSHRIQNIFSVVGGLATLSARDNVAVQPFAQEFRARLGALAKAHNFVRPVGSNLAESHGSLHTLTRAILSPYEQAGAARVVLSGEDVEIGPKAATAFALILHEQATNAVKYGSLSKPDGTVSISTIQQDGALSLRWEERGGPLLDGAPARRGFGAVMTERSVAGQLSGKLHNAWLPTGLVVTLEVPLDQLAR